MTQILTRSLGKRRRQEEDYEEDKEENQFQEVSATRSDDEEPPTKRKIKFTTDSSLVFSAFDWHIDEVDPVASSAEYVPAKTVKLFG